MRSFFALVLAVLMLVAISCAPARQECEGPKDTEYVQALGCVNSFLGCWQSRDFERGEMFLGAELKKSRSKADWDMAICGVSNPHHEAYEVCGWRKTGEHSYQFQVRLYYYYTGEPCRPVPQRKPDVIEVAKEGDYYRVTRVPQL